MHKITILQYRSSADHSHDLTIFACASRNEKILIDLCALLNPFMPEDSSYSTFTVHSIDKHDFNFYSCNDSDMNYSYHLDAESKGYFNHNDEVVEKSISISDSPTLDDISEILRHHFINQNIKEVKSNMLSILKAKKSGAYYHNQAYFSMLEDSIY